MSAIEDHNSGVFESVLANRWNGAILERVAKLGLNDWWLTSGCIAQSVWNAKYGFPPDHGIIDYDLIYFDPDTSWQAEDDVIRKAADVFSELPIMVQIRNQARVPLWYEGKFGVPYPPVRAASDGIDRFPCKTTAVGIRCEGNRLHLHAPFGVSLMLDGMLVPNPVLPIAEVYATKVRRWQAVWPELVAYPWPIEEVPAKGCGQS
jgi:hypothetical protein